MVVVSVQAGLSSSMTVANDLAGRRSDGYIQENARRPSNAERQYMPAIREGQRDYSRTDPISIPSAKSQSRHDPYARSSYSDRDPGFGSMQSSLSRINSNTSSVRRGSDSSYAGSPPRYNDEDTSGIDGMLGWRRSSGAYEPKDMNSSSFGEQRSLGKERYPDRRDEQSRTHTLSQEDSRHRGKDIDGAYGWHGGGDRPVRTDPEPQYRRSRTDGGHGESRYYDSTGKGSRRHYD